MKFTLRSLNVGEPQEHLYQGQAVLSGICKYPVQTAVFLSRLNFSGDKQGDLVNHGGLDKAVNVYSFDHYPYWESRIGHPLAAGAFGENLTVNGALESEVCIGDIFQLGEAVVQVSQPRQPCYKLAMRHGVPDLAVQVTQSGFTGFYLRVLQEGFVSPSDGLSRLERHPAEISIDFANRVMLDKAVQYKEDLRKLLSVQELSANWRESLQKRLTVNE